MLFVWTVKDVHTEVTCQAYCIGFISVQCASVQSKHVLTTPETHINPVANLDRWSWGISEELVLKQNIYA